VITLEHLIYLTERGFAKFYSSKIQDPNRKVVIIIDDWPEGGEEWNVFHAVLDDRKAELDAEKGCREWYYVASGVHGEFENDLKDLGLLVIDVADIKEAKKKLENAREDYLDSEYIRQALADPENKELIPWEQVKKELDLDGQNS